MDKMNERELTLLRKALLCFHRELEGLPDFLRVAAPAEVIELLRKVVPDVGED